MISLELLNRPSFRFAITSIVALLLDLGLVLCLTRILDINLALAAGISFVCVGVVFYFVHEYWTFKRETSASSYRRLSQSLATQILALASRVGGIALLSSVIGTAPIVPEYVMQTCVWAGGVCASFTVNLCLNKFWVFK